MPDFKCFLAVRQREDVSKYTCTVSVFFRDHEEILSTKEATVEKPAALSTDRMRKDEITV